MRQLSERRTSNTRALGSNTCVKRRLRVSESTASLRSRSSPASAPSPFRLSGCSEFGRSRVGVGRIRFQFGGSFGRCQAKCSSACDHICGRLRQMPVDSGQIPGRCWSISGQIQSIPGRIRSKLIELGPKSADVGQIWSIPGQSGRCWSNLPEIRPASAPFRPNSDRIRLNLHDFDPSCLGVGKQLPAFQEVAQTSFQEARDRRCPKENKDEIPVFVEPRASSGTQPKTSTHSPNRCSMGPHCNDLDASWPCRHGATRRSSA